jgi:prevent-host-death family protein
MGEWTSRGHVLACTKEVDTLPSCDYSSHMIATLREGKAHLSALVARAAQGEEVVITVRGKPKARICPLPSRSERDTEPWGRMLKEARAAYSTGTHDSSRTILDHLRGDRS